MNYTYTDQDHRWAQEVLYLHSLWHQGPPTSTPYPYNPPPPPHHHPTLYPPHSSSHPNPNPNPNPSHYYTHYRSACYTAEETDSKKLKRVLSKEKEWPCDPVSVPEQSSPHAPHTWPEFEQAVENPTVSPNTAARGAFIGTQLTAIQSCKYFFSQDPDSESESDSGSENDVDGFFVGIFENVADLKGCYEKNSENGEFYCLVCEAKNDGNKRKGKMYKGCAALVQHASAIQKVGRRVAHRAFARSICRVLGWDPLRLSSSVLLPGSVAKSDNLEDPRSHKKLKRELSQEKEWSCDPASIPEQSPPHMWPSFEQAIQNPTPSPNSASRGALIATQLSAIQSCKDFFSLDSDSESESGSESENDADGFFIGLFENNADLKGCYEKNRENGEFYCLVCEARKEGHKGKGKKYRGCAALVQHASAIRKVGHCAAHRAFARSICRVLGWDPQRLPSIVLLPGSVVKADHLEDKQVTVAIHIPNSTSDSPMISERDTNDRFPGYTIEQEAANKPGSGACSPPEVVPVEVLKLLDFDPDGPDIIVLKTVDFVDNKQAQTATGMISEEAINHVDLSGSPVEVRKEDARFDA